MKRTCMALLLLLLCGACALKVTTAPEENPAPEQEETGSAVEQSIEEEPEPELILPLSGHSISIDPGHCLAPDAVPGARVPISPYSSETKPAFGGGTRGATMTEEQLNLVVGLKLRDALEAQGARVIMTREASDVTVGGEDRVAVGRDGNAEITISIHADGFDDPSVYGMSMLVPTGDLLVDPDIVEESGRLGQLVLDALIQETGAKNRGVVPRRDLIAFNYSQIPVIMLEMGFMTNPQEDALLMTEDYQDKLVRGIVSGVLDWYGVEAAAPS